MDTRTSLIQAAAELLANSTTGDVSTRAICELAGVQQPVLYRTFGDKDALLAAVVDFGFESYLAGKRAAHHHLDAVEDLRAGWDNHTDFALAHPAVYRLMFSPTLASTPSAAGTMMRLLEGVLERIARQGQLKLPVTTAAEMVMSANTGVALSLVTRPEQFRQRELSSLVRDAVIASIVAEMPEPFHGSPQAAASATLLAAQPLGALTQGENTLLHEWLNRIAESKTSTESSSQ